MKAYFECVSAWRSSTSPVTFQFQIFFQRWKFWVNLSLSLLIRLIEEAKERYQSDAIIDRVSAIFPINGTRDDFIVSPDTLDLVVSFLEQFVNLMPESIENPLFREYFCLSSLSFRADLGRKGKEGYLIKQSGGYFKGFSLKYGDLVRVKTHRWFVCYDCCIVWSPSPYSREYSSLFQIDHDFEVIQSGKSISIRNSTREILVRGETPEETMEWFVELRSFYSSRIVDLPYGAKFPARYHHYAQLLVDGSEYFHALAVALLRAQKEILIASWKIKPKLLLTRPPLPPVRLDQLLRYKAEQGIQIYVLLFKEFEYFGRDNDSLRTKKHLRELSQNIRVIRHPNKYFGGSKVFSWSHHEKFVVIDRNMAFVGGTDLSYKRWDNEQYTLVDENELLFPGLEYQQPAEEVMKPVKPKSAPMENENTKGILFDMSPRIQKQVRPKGKLGANIHCDSPRLEEIEPELIDFGEGNTAFELKKIDEKLNKLLIKGEAMKDLSKSPNRYLSSSETRNHYPRMGWHDVQVVISGRAVRDISNHFVQRWNHHRLSKSRHHLPQLLPSTSDFDFSICGKCRREGIYETMETCPRCNYELGPINEYSHPEERSLLPLPLEEFHCLPVVCVFPLDQSLPFDFEGDCPSVVTRVNREGTVPEIRNINAENIPAVGDIIIGIDQTIVSHLSSCQIKRLLNKISCWGLRSVPIHDRLTIEFRRFITKESGNQVVNNHQSLPIALTCNKSRNQGGRISDVCRLSARMEISYNLSQLFYKRDYIREEVPRLCNDGGSCTAQILRSVSSWSLGTRSTECSISQSYLAAIRSANSFIYIENQYIIGLLEGVKNQIVEALIERIIIAYEQQEAFQVFIILPYHTFGDFLDSIEARTMMYYQTETIRKIYRELEIRMGGTFVSQYLNFYGLRNWGVLHDQIVSSQVYVHDKVMIVDDRIIFIGSANINDRSMLGSRDSEIVLRIEDTETIESRLNQRPSLVGRFPHSARIKLMRRLLSNEAIDLIDPLDKNFLEHWKFTATNNAFCYDQIDEEASFDRCTTSAGYRRAVKNYTHKLISDQSMKNITDRIQGFLVNWPHKFLAEENLSPSIFLRTLAPVIKIWQ